MHANLSISLRAILGFVLVLSRLVGIFVYLPLPGKDTGPSLARIVLAMAMALAIVPFWSLTGIPEPTPSLLVLWVGTELAFGLTIGLLVGFLSESLTVGAHILALQAGYAYASVVDPTTQADSDVLQVLAQLTGGLLFFCFGLDHLAVRTFVYSLRSFPPGEFVLTPHLVSAVLSLSSGIFTVGLKLSLPVVALLLTTEIALAIVGRLSTQLHLGASAGAIKMLLTLLVLASLLRVLPLIYQDFARQVFDFIQEALWRGTAQR